ncbi:sel1 repeat family protein [Veillonella parvula]|uniref:tetratricopeptide repeat protein n=1 Tax=Veillonella parvula TaxID=29466 RepID=UPI000E478920|nr:tetratricopeptide repeat protein [Veillonella parvula]RGX05008.1 sel1 repeat family protein [Veillonella parvula]
MAQYFTERLQKVFHMIFTSYNQNMAQEGLRQLELIVNNQQNSNQLKDRALRNDKTSRLESDIDTKEDALKIANDPEARELGDAYALLARVYAGPRFTWEESNFPEDNMRTYQCLHDSIRRCSPIGTLQALRIKGSITPTVEKDMQISFDDAFRVVYDHANRGDTYCQYVIGNVFFWRDDNRIDSAEAMLTPPPMSWTKRIQRSLTANSVQDRIAALQGTVPDETLQENASNLAKKWFNKALDNGLAMFQGNLRNIYIDEADFSNARRVARTAAELGNPAMMLYTGLDCHENGKFEDAFTWFTKGASLGQSESIAELADYYYHFYDAKVLRSTIPYDPVKAIGLYRRAATKQFSDAGYTALQAAFGYIFHIGHLPLDWGLIADLTHMAATKDRFMFALPYIGYMRIHGLGVTKNIRFGVQSLLRVLDEEQRAFEEENHVLFYDITRALTRVALGYAYEKGYVTGKPDLTQAVSYYEQSHQYILSHKTNLDPELKDIPIDDEAEERLAAFEEVDGHWQYKEGITESTTTVRPAPTTWPQNAARLSVTMDDFLWDTTLYDWQTIETALESQEEMKLSFYNHFLSVPDTLRNIFKVDVKRMLRDHYQIRLHGYDPSEGHEIIYKSIYDKENTISLLKELYDNHQVPSIEGNWTIEKNEEKPTWHYVLDVDQQPFLLEEYDDANAMIQAALQGLKEKKYEQINIRTHDFVGPSYFIFKGKQSTPFRVQLYLKESARHTIDDDGNQQDTPGKTYLFEQYVGNEVSLNYWIQKTINTLEIPELDNWKQLTVPKDLQT